jgi:hypothetical protein
MARLALLLILSAAPSPPEGCLRPEAVELVPLLGVEPSVAALCAGAADQEDGAARGALTERAVQASLEVDSAIAAIQEEQTSISDQIDALRSARDARVGWLNAGAGILAAGAAVGTGMTLRAKTTTAGIWVTTITSGIGALFTIYAALAPARGVPPVQTRTNLLAPFLDRPLEGGRYPRVVWDYLAAAPPGGGPTRRERLVERWTRLGRVDPAGGADARRRLDALCRPIPEHGEADADLLQDRSRMLADVRAQVATMKAGLRSLLELVSTPPRRRAGSATGDDRVAELALRPLPGRFLACPIDGP